MNKIEYENMKNEIVYAIHAYFSDYAISEDAIRADMNKLSAAELMREHKSIKQTCLDCGLTFPV